MQPPLLICDFDGTLTRVDVGDALCERFADPSWRDVDAQWLRGEISLPEAQRRMWATVRATTAELVREARRVGSLRPGADDVLAAAADGRIELVIASGGFDLYIGALLGDRAAAVSAMYHNRLVPREGGVEPAFREDLSCERCAVCKGRVVHAHRDDRRRVAFCGDGSSDRCAAGVAPELFAVRGSTLARHCERRGVPHVPFDDLGTVLSALLDG